MREGDAADEVDRRAAELRLSFEPADIVNEVMSFGSPTPIEVAVSGPNLADNRAYAEKIYRELSKVPALRDLQLRPVARLPDGRSRRRPREGRRERRDGRGRGPRRGAGHVVEPLRRAELTGPIRQRHRLPGAGRSPVCTRWTSPSDLETGPGQAQGHGTASGCATSAGSARGRCRASSTATT